MKTCPICGSNASDDAVVCRMDGAGLTDFASAVTLPVQSGGQRFCGSCGTTKPGEDEVYCALCSRRIDGMRSIVPGEGDSKIGDFDIIGRQGEGSLLVTDSAGIRRLLVFGPMLAIRDEGMALDVSSTVFPSVVGEGHSDAFGYFVVLTVEYDGARPLGDVSPTFAEGIALVRDLLDVAEEMERRGFTWAPLPGDLYVRPAGGRIVASRARGARRRLQDEPLNAKRVLEALRESLLPAPFAHGTPELVRLLLPRSNFSTLATRTIAAARQEVLQAEAAASAKDASATAELCDPGLRRNHNEDAIGVAHGDVSGEPFVVLVVCDGVSSSTHADRASAIASHVAKDALVRFAQSGDVIREPTAPAVEAAIRAAHLAICDADIDYGDGAPPGTTIVAALVFRGRLTVGWVGDSRAYWVSEDGAELCTTDHSWLNDVVARGNISYADALASPLAHALTRCLGPLETRDGVMNEANPDVRQKPLSGPGHIVLCTDGLWNYFPSAGAIADLVRRAGKGADPSAIARFLVCSALIEGGGDNVSVAVHAFAGDAVRTPPLDSPPPAE